MGMNKLTLTAHEIHELKQAHRACKDKRAADRIKAVYIQERRLLAFVALLLKNLQLLEYNEGYSMPNNNFIQRCLKNAYYPWLLWGLGSRCFFYRVFCESGPRCHD